MEGGDVHSKESMGPWVNGVNDTVGGGNGLWGSGGRGPCGNRVMVE